MIKRLINPFIYIAGAPSLIAGILIIFLTSVIGYYSNTYFPDVISVKTAPGLKVWYLIILGFSNWLVLSTVLYLAAVIFSKSSVRVVDIFGTQALARFPYLLASFIGFSGSIDRFGKYVLWTYLQKGEPVIISVSTMIFAIILIVITIMLTVWLIVLNYNAFKVSANIKGTKSIVLFTTSLIISIVFTSLFSKFLFIQFS
ncbi:MAG TPA: hypothetical protein PLR88_01660 [Bacteroidales bacterium]|nr:hypothetical protein [Bacteroidales bacterium]